MAVLHIDCYTLFALRDMRTLSAIIFLPHAEDLF